MIAQAQPGGAAAPVATCDMPVTGGKKLPILAIPVCERRAGRHYRWWPAIRVPPALLPNEAGPLMQKAHTIVIILFSLSPG